MGVSNRATWEEFWLSQAQAWASRSKVPTTQVGCVLVHDDKEPLSYGFNSPPRGFPDQRIHLLTRDEMRHICPHAEVNAIANAARRVLLGSVAYVSHPPCAQCTAALINAGITKIVYVGELHKDWSESLDMAKWLAGACNVEMVRR